jgi:hypothetical protein
MKKLSFAFLALIVSSFLAVLFLSGFSSQDETLTPVKSAVSAPADMEDAGTLNYENNGESESPEPPMENPPDAGAKGAMPGKAAAGYPDMDASSKDSTCPMSVPGTKVSTEDSGNGAALKFSTTDKNVAELQQKVQDMVNRHNTKLSGGATEMGSGAYSGRRMHEPIMMASTATFQATKEGALLIFTPSDSAKLNDLRAEVSEHASYMTKNGACPMHGSMQKAP